MSRCLEVQDFKFMEMKRDYKDIFQKKLLLNLKFVYAIGQGARFVQYHVIFLVKKLGSIHPGAYVMV